MAELKEAGSMHAENLQAELSRYFFPLLNRIASLPRFLLRLILTRVP